MSLTEKLKTSLQLDKKALQLEYAFEEHVNFEQRTITIQGDIEENDFAWFDAAMSELEKLNGKTITVKINSYGGDIYETNAMIGRLRDSKCRVITEGYGKIMSCAFLILASGDKRRMSKYAIAMHHSILYSVAYNKAFENKAYVKQCEKEEEMCYKMLEEFTDVNWIVWKEMADGKPDKFLTADQCLNLKVVDEVF